MYRYLLTERCDNVSFGLLYGLPNITDDLVSHADDLPCLFQSKGAYGLLEGQSSEQRKTSQAMVKAWTNFAKYLEVTILQYP